MPLVDQAIFGDTALTDSQGRVLTGKQWYSRVKRHEALYDRLTMQACEYHRAKGERLPGWLLKAELQAWERTRRREERAVAYA